MVQNERKTSTVHVVGNMDWDGLHRPQIYYAMVAIFRGCSFRSSMRDMQRGLAHDCASVANLFLRFHLDSQCFPTGGRHDPLPCSALGERSVQTYLSEGNGLLLYRRFVVLCLVRFVCPVGSFHACCKAWGAAMVMSVNGSLVRLIYPETPSGQRFRAECHGRGFGSVAGPIVRCYFVRVFLAMAVCREFAVRRTDILFGP